MKELKKVTGVTIDMNVIELSMRVGNIKFMIKQALRDFHNQALLQEERRQAFDDYISYSRILRRYEDVRNEKMEKSKKEVTEG